MRTSTVAVRRMAAFGAGTSRWTSRTPRHEIAHCAHLTRGAVLCPGAVSKNDESRQQQAGQKWFTPLVWIADVVEKLDGGIDLSPAKNELPDEWIDEEEVYRFQYGDFEHGAIVLSGGCFWCCELALQQAGLDTTCGYIGGLTLNPSYGKVASKKSGHVEAVLVTLRPGDDVEAILRTFLSNIDPSDSRGQGPNYGPQYRPAIFYTTESQRVAAEEALARKSDEMGGRVTAVRLRKASRFWIAEEAHQSYYDKNGLDPHTDKPHWLGAFLD